METINVVSNSQMPTREVNYLLIKGAKVKFYTDVSPENQKKLDNPELIGKSYDKGILIMTLLIHSWNFGDDKGIIFPINKETFEAKLSKGTMKWLLEQTMMILEDLEFAKKK